MSHQANKPTSQPATEASARPIISPDDVPVISLVCTIDKHDPLMEEISIEAVNDLSGDRKWGNYEIIIRRVEQPPIRLRVEHWARGASLLGMMAMLLQTYVRSIDENGQWVPDKDLIYGGPPPKDVAMRSAVAQCRMVESKVQEARA